ncbi:2211_t:CDS:2, partial [Gigaspora rosea]
RSATGSYVPNKKSRHGHGHENSGMNMGTGHKALAFVPMPLIVPIGT